MRLRTETGDSISGWGPPRPSSAESRGTSPSASCTLPTRRAGGCASEWRHAPSAPVRHGLQRPGLRAAVPGISNRWTPEPPISTSSSWTTAALSRGGARSLPTFRPSWECATTDHPATSGIPRNVSLGLLAAQADEYDYVIISNSDVIYPRNLVPRCSRWWFRMRWAP